MNDNAIVQDSGSRAISSDILEEVLVKGNIESLSTEQRLDYYRSVCESVGLNPLTKPFQYIKLNNRLTLYATKDATDQIRKTRNVSIVDMQAEKIDDLFRVQVKAQDASGRTEISTGVVSVAGLKGDNLANAMMKAETKAKRRVTLSLCGLGILDESEIEAIPSNRVQFVEMDEVQPVLAPPDDDFDPEPDPQPQPSKDNSKISAKAISKIDQLAKDLKLTPEMFVEEMEAVTGKTSLSSLTMAEARKLWTALEKMTGAE